MVVRTTPYTGALGLTSSRSSDYSLVKELSLHKRPTTTFVAFVVRFPFLRGGGMIASAGRLSTGVERDSRPRVPCARIAQRERANRAKPVPFAKASVSKSVADATSGRHRFARVQAPEPTPTEEWFRQTFRIMTPGRSFVKCLATDPMRRHNPALNSTARRGSGSSLGKISSIE